MFRFLLSTIATIFVLVVVGSILLDTFPQLLPLWEEFKHMVVSLYNVSKVKYGAAATVVIIVAIGILLGSSKRSI